MTEPQADKTPQIEELTQTMALGRAKHSPKIPIDVTAGGRRYTGDFVFMRPAIYDAAEMLTRASELMSVFDPKTGAFERRPATIYGDTLAHQIATLETVVVSSPTWWDLQNLTEFDVLHLVYKAFQTWRDRFQGDVPGADPADSKERPE